MKYALIIIIQFFSIAALAQKSDTIRFYKNRFYVGNEKLSYTGLKSRLLSYPSSETEYKLYGKNALPGTLFGFAALGLDIVALTKIDNNKFLPWFIPALALGTIQMLFMHSANKHLKKGAHLYNTEVTSF